MLPLLRRRLPSTGSPLRLAHVGQRTARRGLSTSCTSTAWATGVGGGASRQHRLRVELHCTDIVAAPPGSAGGGMVLINAANESLVGTQRSYFPRGGPCPSPPPPGVSNSWGGMEAGPNMLCEPPWP